MIFNNPYTVLIYFFLAFVGVVLLANCAALLINAWLRRSIDRLNASAKIKLPHIESWR